MAKNIYICRNSKRDNRNSLIRRLLSGITNEELENLVRVREGGRIPIPTPRRNVQQYRPVPAPRMKNQQPIAGPRMKIDEKRRALKHFTKSYETGVKSDRDALVQFQNTRLAISRLFNVILNEMRGFKFVETLKVTFVKRKDEHNIYKLAYFNRRAQMVINPNDFLPSLGLSQHKLLNGIGVWLSHCSG